MLGLDNQAQHRGDRGGYCGGFTCRPYANEDDGIIKAGRQLVSDRYRDGCFANASRPNDGDKPLLRKFLRYQKNFIRSSNYFSHRPGQTGMREVGIGGRISRSGKRLMV
jgi:hypothetical protein